MNLKDAERAAARAAKSAAVRNAKWLRSEDVKSAITPRNIALVLLVCFIGGFGYCQGKRTAYSAATSKELASAWNRWADSVNALHDQTAKDSLSFVSAIGHANAARTTYKKVSSRIAVVNKDLVAIDDGPPTPEVAASIVQELIASANEALTKDSSVHVATMTYLGDVKAQVAVLTHERDIAVEQYQRVKPKWYQTWKAGAMSTLAAIVGLALVLK